MATYPARLARTVPPNAPSVGYSLPVSASLMIYQGDDWSRLVAVSNDDGTPFDLTGWTPEAQIRDDVADAEPVIAAEITAAIDDALSGVISLSLTHDVTVTLSGQYVWDMQLTSPVGMVTTILAGGVTVTQEVTRD